MINRINMLSFDGRLMLIDVFSLYFQIYVMWLAFFYNLKIIQITKWTGDMKKPRLYLTQLLQCLFLYLFWEHSPLQKLPSSEEAIELPFPLCRFHKVKTEKFPEWADCSRHPGTLVKGHFDDRQLELHGEGDFPTFKIMARTGVRKTLM